MKHFTTTKEDYKNYIEDGTIVFFFFFEYYLNCSDHGRENSGKKFFESQQNIRINNRCMAVSELSVENGGTIHKCHGDDEWFRDTGMIDDNSESILVLLL